MRLNCIAGLAAARPPNGLCYILLSARTLARLRREGLKKMAPAIALAGAEYFPDGGCGLREGGRWAIATGRSVYWREEVGPRLQAEVRHVRYFLRQRGRTRLSPGLRWGDWDGRRRVNIGTFGTVAEAKAVCDAHAAALLRREREAGPVDVRIAPGRRR